MRFEDWPEADRVAWEAILAEGDIFDGRGLAANWRAATRRTNAHHYARWLGHLARTGNLRPAPSPADRVTRESVAGYVEAFRPTLSPVTLHSTIVGLRVVIGAMTPDRDWRWLSKLCARLKRRAEPQANRRARMRPIQEIYRVALKEMDRLSAIEEPQPRDCVNYRTSLMIALLAARPVRLQNLVSMRLGFHLCKDGGGWSLQFPAHEVKNSQALAFDLPPSLLPYLERYLVDIRPRLLGTANHDHVWVARLGAPLRYSSTYSQFRHGTERLLGVSINPHLFRDCAATSLALASTSDALAAAALLGHRDFATTERHYIRARQIDANRRITGVLDAIRAEGRRRQGNKP